MGHGGVLRVFPVWPKEKDASFNNLRTYGAFLVSSELKKGKVTYVKIVSEKGKVCQLKNPWPESEVKISSNMSKSRRMKGKILEIETRSEEVLTLIGKR